MLKPIPLCPVDPRPADTWPGSLKDIRDRLDDHVSDRHDPHGTLDMESVKRVVGTGSASVETEGAEVTVTVPDRLSGFVNDRGYVTSGHVWKQSSVEGLSKALADMAADVAAKAPLENGTVPAGAIPDQFDEVLFYSSGMDFINDVGRPGKLYVDMSGNGIYRWSESGTFVALDGGLGRLVGNQVAALKELMKKEYAVRNHDHDERYSAKDHDHDGRYVPFEMEVLTDQWDVIPPDGHDASEYETPWIEWGDTFGSGTESWEYSPHTNTPESVSFDRDERGPLAVRLEVKGSAGGEFADGHIVRRVVTVRMFGTSNGEVVLGDNFPKASGTSFGAVKVGTGLSVDGGVISSDAYTKTESDGLLRRKADAEYDAMWYVRGLPDDVPRMYDLAIQKTGNTYRVVTINNGGRIVPVDLTDGHGTVDLKNLLVYVEFIVETNSNPLNEPTCVLNVYDNDPVSSDELIVSVSTDSPADRYSYVSVKESVSRAKTEVIDVTEDHVNTAKRYVVAYPSAGDGSVYQLSDYAVNVVNVSSPGEYTFVFPPRTGSRVRDFVLKLNVTADPLPTVSFVKHETDDEPPRFEGADGWSELELGVNFFGFTESS